MVQENNTARTFELPPDDGSTVRLEQGHAGAVLEAQ